MAGPPPFDRHGPHEPASPVVISVPHAGRDYPAPLHAALRGTAGALVALEDRHVDAVALASRQDEVLFIQRRARAWIDLNRAEDERDPRIDEGASPIPSGTGALRLRSGLGLIPRRAAAGSELWRRRWTRDEVEARIAADHRPYHLALAAALAAAQARFGTAVLLDLHSMPPPAPRAPARVVIGDRFGRTASARFVARAEAATLWAGQVTALNIPYAGGHIVERHGTPAAGIHAIQLELDRSLYLDRALDRPTPAGVQATARLVRAVIDALADEALATGAALAAE